MSVRALAELVESWDTWRTARATAREDYLALRALAAGSHRAQGAWTRLSAATSALDAATSELKARYPEELAALTELVDSGLTPAQAMRALEWLGEL